MDANSLIHLAAGQALELAQRLEAALVVPIRMLLLLESGSQKDFSGAEFSAMVAGAKAEYGKRLEHRPVDHKLRQDLLLKEGQVLLDLRNGTMGAVVNLLQSFLRAGPGGPPAQLAVLQKGLKARNHLCHEFFKCHSSAATDGSTSDALAELEEIQSRLLDAISFSENVAETVRRQFPRTFSDGVPSLH